MSRAIDDAILESLDEMESFETAMDETSLIDIVSDDIFKDEDDAELIDCVIDD